MLAMFLDKCGAVTVLSAFKAIVKQKLRVNLTCTIGLAENSINENAYRPSHIIASRKGLTVEIGNTDNEGRLVLADCMNWILEKFMVKTLIELSTHSLESSSLLWDMRQLDSSQIVRNYTTR